MPLDGRAGKGWRRELSSHNADTSSAAGGSTFGGSTSRRGDGGSSLRGGASSTRVVEVERGAARKSDRSDARKTNGGNTTASGVTPTSPLDRNERRKDPSVAANQSLFSILLHTAYVATIASLIKPDDEEDVAIRKHVIGLVTFVGLPSVVILFVECASYLYTVPTLIGSIALFLVFILGVIVYVVALRLGTVPHWLFNLASAVPISLGFLAQFLVPGAALFASTASAMLFTNHAVGVARLVMILTSAASLTLYSYNIIALRHDWPLPGYNARIPVAEFTIAIFDISAIFIFFFVHQYYDLLYEKHRQARDAQDALVFSASKLLLVFDLEGLTSLYDSVQDDTKDEHTLGLLEAFTKTVAQFRPHVPHYVLSRSTAVLEADLPADVVTRTDAASSRHPRRMDHRGSVARSSIGGGDEGSMRSGRSLSYQARRVSDDVQSSRTMRSEVATFVRQQDQQTMSPIFLARTKPLITRRVTIALLEYWVPPEFATTKGLELLVDTLLAKADDNEGSVHCVVGDTAVVSWNAIRSVNAMERLACRYCAEVTWYMRNEFERQFLQRQQLNGGSPQTPRAMLDVPVHNFGMDLSTSNVGTTPRVSGGIMTGEARVCFAGTKTCEFCMSYSWQPVLLGLKKIATGNHMICCDATTRSSAGTRLKTRAIGSIGVTGGASISGTKGFAHSHTGMDKSHVSRSDRPLVELQQSPQTSHMELGVPGGTITNSFEVPDDLPTAAFDLVAYEIVALLTRSDTASNAPQSQSQSQPQSQQNTITTTTNSGDRANLSTASAFMRSSFGGLPGSNTLDTGDEDDDDMTAMNLVMGSPQPTSSGLNARLQSKQRRPEDPDELLTKAVHLAANDKKYAEAAKKFREVIDILKARNVENAQSPRAQSGKSMPDFPVFATNRSNTGAGVRGVLDPLDEYAYDEDSVNPALAMPPPAQPEVPKFDGAVSGLTTPQLITLVSRLLTQALKCAENPNRPFAESVVSAL